MEHTISLSFMFYAGFVVGCLTFSAFMLLKYWFEKKVDGAARDCF